jgi:hypothetical protein
MLERLRQISQRTWREIRQLDRHGYGTETISRGSIRAVLPSFLTEDVRLLAFRAFDLVASVPPVPASPRCWACSPGSTGRVPAR